MSLTRRAFARAGAALAAATILPVPGKAQPALMVRRSLNELIVEQSPLIESYRRAVDVMMKRDVTDKTSWWFQANIHSLPDEEAAQLRSYAAYWHKCPHKNYFFPSWHRMYVYFFERIVRKASGDPNFALPYWRYDDPRQASLPSAFLPEDAELGTPPENKAIPYLTRKNALARAKRHGHVDHRWIGLGDVARDVTAAFALDHFTVTDKLDALKAFGGVRVSDPSKEEAAGGLEASPHNLVHKTIGLDGDLGSPKTAARDPVFWVHHANIDRMWVKWTDPARDRIPPVDDDVWMKTKFTFVDENGEDRGMTGADVLDTQFQLGYRYDDDPPRVRQLRFDDPPVAFAPGGSTPTLRAPVSAPDPVVLAKGGAMRLAARESQVVLAAVSQPPAGGAPAGPQRLRVVLKDVVARDDAPPYDVFLVLEGSIMFAVAASAVRIGGLDLFGGAGQGGHGAHAGHAQGGDTIAFDASDAMAQLSRLNGFDMQSLRVSVVRRGFTVATGGELVPPDPDPLQIGSVELVSF
jgi:tyrosinase